MNSILSGAGPVFSETMISGITNPGLSVVSKPLVGSGFVPFVTGSVLFTGTGISFCFSGSVPLIWTL